MALRSLRGAAGPRLGPADLPRPPGAQRGVCSGGQRRPRAVPAQALAGLSLRPGGRRRRLGRLHLAAKRRALERRLDPILAAPSHCELTRALQAKLRRARDQLLTFVDWPGQVEATNNACERDLRPAVIQRKVTNGYRAMWAAQGEADVRTVVDTARLAPNTSIFGTILTTVTA